MPLPTLTSNSLNTGVVAWYIALNATGTGTAWPNLLGGADGTVTSPSWGSTTQPGGLGKLSTPRVVAPWPKPASAMTLAAWVYSTGTQAADATIIGGGGSTILRTFGTNNIIFYRFQGGALFYMISYTALPADAWTRVVATYDGSDMRFYMNGGADLNYTAGAGTIDTAADVFGIGHNGGFAEGWAGAINDVKVWSRALSASEVADEYGQSYNGNPDLLSYSTAAGAANLAHILADANGPTPSGSFLTLGTSAGFLSLQS